MTENLLHQCAYTEFRPRAHDQCNAYSFVASFAFVRDPCCLTLNFVIAFWIMITFYILLTLLFCIIIYLSWTIQTLQTAISTISKTLNTVIFMFTLTLLNLKYLQIMQMHICKIIFIPIFFFNHSKCCVLYLNIKSVIMTKFIVTCNKLGRYNLIRSIKTCINQNQKTIIV